MASYHERGFNALVFTYWQLPPRLGQRMVRLLLTSSASRVVELRHQLAVMGTPMVSTRGIEFMDADAFFQRTATPAAMMRILDDLRATGTLSLADVCEVEEAILRCTSVEGRWVAR